MNSFANSLLALLFGWARTLIQEVWTTAASGRYSGFLAWLGDHWLWLALFLCLCCTAVDFLVWMVRWRPYLVWRTSYRRFLRLFRRDREAARRFEHGYQGGVALDIPQEQREPVQENWEDDALREASKTPPQPDSTHTFTQAVVHVDAPMDTETLAPSRDGAFDFEAVTPETAAQRRFAPAMAYEPPPMQATARASSVYGTDMPPVQRRRRSEKYERRRAEWREKLIKGDADEYDMLDGLPPAVDRQQAFHEPVYPRQSAGADPYAGWQRPSSGNQSTDGRA